MPVGSALSVASEVVTSTATEAPSLERDLQRFVGLPATQANMAAMNNIWVRWNTDQTWLNATASSITSYTTNSATWSAWNNSTLAVTASGSVYTIDNTWANWNAGTATIYNRNCVVAPVETPDQRIAREARYAEQRRVQEEERLARLATRKEADAKAEALLRAHLIPDQQEQLAREDWFLIVSKSGKKYRIFRGRAGNIDLIDETGKALKSLCVHPRDDVPDADTMLAQALMLRFDEESLLRLANASQPRTRPNLRLVPPTAPVAQAA